MKPISKLNQLAYASASVTAMIFVAGAANAQVATAATAPEGNIEFSTTVRAQQETMQRAGRGWV